MNTAPPRPPLLSPAPPTSHRALSGPQATTVPDSVQSSVCLATQPFRTPAAARPWGGGRDGAVSCQAGERGAVSGVQRVSWFQDTRSGPPRAPSSSPALDAASGQRSSLVGQVCDRSARAPAASRTTTSVTWRCISSLNFTLMISAFFFSFYLKTVLQRNLKWEYI